MRVHKWEPSAGEELSSAAKPRRDRVAEREAKKRRRRAKAQIDSVFADMENAFNGLSTLLFEGPGALCRALRRWMSCLVLLCTTCVMHM